MTGNIYTRLLLARILVVEAHYDDVIELNNKQPKLALENTLIAYSASPNKRNLLLVFIYEK
jgi:hypothetical protein|tara:strand:+ start:217 stop:399 length:183 start_codon:yes stop_codon:yes gene_type:complete